MRALKHLNTRVMQLYTHNSTAYEQLVNILYITVMMAIVFQPDFLSSWAKLLDNVPTFHNQNTLLL